MRTVRSERWSEHTIKNLAQVAPFYTDVAESFTAVQPIMTKGMPRANHSGSVNTRDDVRELIEINRTLLSSGDTNTTITPKCQLPEPQKTEEH